MNKRIVYFTNGYLPDREGVSKELSGLYSHFKETYPGGVYLYNLADNWRFGVGRGHFSYPDRLLPLGYPFLKYLEKTSDLVHIYGSLTGRIYLKLLKRRPIILTNASSLITSRLEQCASMWENFDAIVLESERDLQTVQQMGINPQRTFLIYPGLSIHDIPQASMHKPFTVLFASAPMSNDPQSIHRRGVALLIETAKKLKDCNFILLWRGKHSQKLKRLLSRAGTTNTKVIDKIISDPTRLLAEVHCTILTPQNSDECKPCPNSLVESLTHGRPVITSQQIGISNLVKNENCGVIVYSGVDGIAEGIRELQKNYKTYVKNTIPTAKKYFSKKKFLDAYEKLYNKFLKI